MVDTIKTTTVGYDANYQVTAVTYPNSDTDRLPVFHVLRNPFARIRLWIGIGIGLAFLAVIGGMALFSSVECTSTSTGDVKEKIARELPVGSTSAAIVAWLDANGIQRYGPRSAGAYSELRSRGVSPTAQVIEGFIPNTGFLGLATTKNITVFFVLTQDGRLGDVIVVEEHTALWNGPALAPAKTILSAGDSAELRPRRLARRPRKGARTYTSWRLTTREELIVGTVLLESTCQHNP